MPVLSPHRSSSSGLSGSYRSALDRPFYGSSSYSPRFTSSYSERFTTRSYTDTDGRRIYSRSGSITEDGVTTRFREESREPSVKRDSISRDSIRENSISDYSRGRDGSLTRNERLSAVNVLDSVAEMRNKYSPANYVPACMRKNDNIARSKSINDIGLPPIEAKGTKKKVNDRVESIFTNSVAYSNNTNTDNLTDEDDNGNRASVADLCKKFDDKHSRIVKNGLHLASAANKPSDLTNGKTKRVDVKKSSSVASVTKKTDNFNNKCHNNTDVLQSNSKLEVNEDTAIRNGSEVDRDDGLDDTSDSIAPSKNNSRVNNFSSYITVSTKDFQRGDETQTDGKDYSKNDMDNKENFLSKMIQTSDLSTSPKLTRTAISPSNSIQSSLNSSSLSRRSSERDRESHHRIRDYSDDDSGGERAINSYGGSAIRPNAYSADAKCMGLNGLKNIGNTCFMNSVIQCLSNTSDNDKAQEAWRRYLRMDNSKIVDHFVGQLKSTLKCTYCGHCSVTFDPFWDLSLPIPQRTGQLRLSQCLDCFTREETLDGDEKPTCSKCKERRRCTKSFSIHKFPKVLVIHLKRFSPTERFRGKLNVTIDFPLEDLDMSQYAADNVVTSRYNLYAISNHSGTTYSGHYTAYCRHPYTGQWHEYNDSRVSPISPRSLVSGEAYVLFYEQEGTKSHL
ncbi:unnamed protein product [Psylliodes chrysocephalus]|uniref:Ubiquitin carboxyl-terminal hydrolase n=1 Tax=Psylliodes chrysocephalus TaxID=3402493 RepID=A0A9P0CQE3_9CUCU|nr:unnamed protein product [Psylliodes chrysocephala]